jgi:hypothetical protein
MSNDFVEQMKRFVLDPKNEDAFAEALHNILPHYTKWRWGQDSIFRRYFTAWQESGFLLMPNHYYNPVPDIPRLSRQSLGTPFRGKLSTARRRRDALHAQ